MFHLKNTILWQVLWANRVDKYIGLDRKRNRRHYFNSFKIFKKLDVDVEDLSISALIRLIEENPSLLRRPIILDNKRMQIGFNEDEIRAFLPRSYRKQELRSATLRAEIN